MCQFSKSLNTSSIWVEPSQQCSEVNQTPVNWNRLHQFLPKFFWWNSQARVLFFFMHISAIIYLATLNIDDLTYNASHFSRKKAMCLLEIVHESSREVLHDKTFCDLYLWFHRDSDQMRPFSVSRFSMFISPQNRQVQTDCNIYFYYNGHQNSSNHPGLKLCPKKSLTAST